MQNKDIFTKAVIILTVITILITLCPTVSETQPGFCNGINSMQALILPPVCFTRQMYSGTENITPGELLSSKNVTVRVRLKIVDILSDLWHRLR